MTTYATPPCMDCGQITSWNRPNAALRRRCSPCNRPVLGSQASAATLARNADIDELNVELLAAGYRTKATRAEYTEAARILLNHNLTYVNVAARLGVSTRSVDRYAAAMRDAA